MINIEVINDIEIFRSLREDWNTLLKKSNNDSIFLTWEWLYIWWSTFRKDNSLYILTYKENDGSLQGIAPLYIRKRRALKFIDQSELRMLGSGIGVSSEYLNFICIQGKEKQIIAAFLKFLIATDNKWDIFSITDISDSSVDISILHEIFTKNRMVYICTEERPFCPIVNLPAKWELYLNSLNRQMRANVKKARKKIMKDFNKIEIRSFNNCIDEENTFNKFIQLHTQRRKQKNTIDRFNDKDYEKFHQRIHRLFGENKWLNLYFLNLNGQDVAAQYGFRYHDIIYLYQSGLNPNFSKYGVGQVLIGYILERAISEGIKTCDMLRGEEWYKMRWANELKKKYQIIISNSNSGNTFVNYLKTKSVCFAGIKKLLPKNLKEKIDRKFY